MWVSQFSGVNSPSEVQNLGINQKSRTNFLGNFLVIMNFKFLLLKKAASTRRAEINLDPDMAEVRLS